MDSIFKNGIAPTPDVNGGHEGTRGGFDLPDGKKETPGTTIGTLPTLTNVNDFRAILIEREAEYQQDIRNRFATSADLLEAAE